MRRRRVAGTQISLLDPPLDRYGRRIVDTLDMGRVRPRCPALGWRPLRRVRTKHGRRPWICLRGRHADGILAGRDLCCLCSSVLRLWGAYLDTARLPGLAWRGNSRPDMEAFLRVPWP